MTKKNKETEEDRWMLKKSEESEGGQRREEREKMPFSPLLNVNDRRVQRDTSHWFLVSALHVCQCFSFFDFLRDRG